MWELGSQAAALSGTESTDRGPARAPFPGPRLPLWGWSRRCAHQLLQQSLSQTLPPSQADVHRERLITLRYFCQAGSDSALGRARSWEVRMLARATLLGKNLLSEWCSEGWGCVSPADRQQSSFCSRPPSTTQPLCQAPQEAARHTGGYSSAAASSDDGQMPHKDSGTALAPCTSTTVEAAGKVSARRNHAMQRL